MNKEMEKYSDHRSMYRNLTFKYLSYYLNNFLHTHSAKYEEVNREAGFGGSTLHLLLSGKDMHFNCYLRLLTTLEEYCKDEEEYVEFMTGFMKRAIVEIWILWELEPSEWMVEVWETMQKESEDYKTKSD